MPLMPGTPARNILTSLSKESIPLVLIDATISPRSVSVANSVSVAEICVIARVLICFGALFFANPLIILQIYLPS